MPISGFWIVVALGWLVLRAAHWISRTSRTGADGADYLFRAWRATGHGTLPILFLDGLRE